MRRKKNNEIFFFAGVIVVIILIIAMIVMPGRGPESATDSNTPVEPNTVSTVPDANALTPNIQTPVVSPATPIQPKIALSELIDAADAWLPCAEHQAWIGKAAPDFVITDIDQKQHTLSSYRGKSVIINFWAPWFTPTLTELETLIQLKRQAVEPDKLIILGVSFDSLVTVKRYVNKQTAINFPIISSAANGGSNPALPAPYSTGQPLPCSMFVTPDGILKLSARGSIPLADFQAILNAK
ncbi:MAG: redoxin domain-containing protein [Phycisphaeraceae bacterium]|nr:redoxin domain-containing protein [Phycisphaeraceae bacterium]